MSSRSRASKFLEVLGINRRFRRDYDDYDPPPSPPADSDDHEDAMNVRDMDWLFATEQRVVKALGGNHERLLQSMLRVSSTPALFPATTVADVGGGPGIVALWVATQHPHCRVRVYDYSANSLALGERWARRLELTDRVTYHLTSYEEIAKDASLADSCDFAFAEYALDFTEPTEADVQGESLPQWRTRVRQPRYLALARALVHLLKPNHRALVATGDFGPEALTQFAACLRGVELALDWELTQQQTANWEAYTLVMCASQPCVQLFDTPEEDALSVLSLRNPTLPRQLPHRKALSLAKQFSAKGRRMLRAELEISMLAGPSTRPPDGEISIWQVGGEILMLERWPKESGWPTRGTCQSAATLPTMVSSALDLAHGCGIPVVAEEIDPKVRALFHV